MNTMLYILRLNFVVPLELSVMNKEYFNRWYSLGTYYLSITLVDLPVQVNDKYIVNDIIKYY